MRIIALIILFASVCFAEEIKKVEFTGNTKITDEALQELIKLKPGQRLSSSKVTEDIKSLFSLGYFAGISAYQKDGVVTFVVEERPAIKNVLVQGNEEVSTSKLKEFLVPEDRRFLSRTQLRKGINKAISYYQTQGFYSVKIDFDINEVSDKEVEIVYTVREGKEQIIREVRVSGNESLDEDEVLSVVQTSEYSWYSSWITGSGKLDKEMLEQDKALITRLYLTKGHVEINVIEPLIEEVEDGLKVTFRVREGAKYNFGSVFVTDLGEDILDEPANTDLEVETGETFNVDELQGDVFTITERFADKGYAFANVQPKTALDKERQLVSVTFAVDRGPEVSIGRIKITGNTKTNDNVIRRSLSIEEGQRYSGSKVERSKQLIQRTGFFEAVDLTTERTSKDDEVNLLVNVKEGSTGQFSAGVGVSSNDGVLFNVNYRETNVFGTGNSLSLVANTGNIVDNYIISFRNPRVDDTRWSFGASGRISGIQFDDFTREQDGGSFSFGYPLWFLGEEYLDDIRFSIEYEYVDVEISDVSDTAAQFVKDEEGKTSASSVTPRIIRDTINNPLFPTAGSRQVFSVEYAGLGGKEDYVIFDVSNTFYYTVLEGEYGSLIVSNRTGFAWSDSDGPLPLFKRFFGGGINSVRSFDARELGPRDEEGNVFGGSKELVSSSELIFPLVESAQLSGLVFFDIGNSFDDGQSVDIGELEQAVGWGIRWRSPIAPIRFEVGYPIGGGEGSSTTTHFSFGAPL